MDKKRIQYLKFSSIILFFLIYFLLFLLLKIEPLFCQHVSVDPTYHNFGKINVGSTSSPLIVEIINFGDKIAYFTINLQDNSNFSLNLEEGLNPCGSLEFSLDPGVLCTVSVSFTPQTINYFMSFLEVSFSQQDGLRGGSGTQLVGIGFPNISVSPESHNFGDFIVGNSSLPKIFTVSNTGNSPISITKIELSDTTNYSLNLNGGLHPCGTITEPLQQGKSCTFSVEFSPQSQGIFNSLVTINSNAVGSQILKIPISGSSGAQGYTWVKAFKDQENKLRVRTLKQTSEGGYILAGNNYTTGDIWIMKIDGDGNIQWKKSFGGSKIDEVEYIQQTSDGGYLLAGNTSSFGVGNVDFWIIKLDKNGEIIWQNTYGGDAGETTNSILETSDGYVVAGWSGSLWPADTWILKLNKNDGRIIWQKAYGFEAYYNYRGESISEIREIPEENGFIVAGVVNTVTSPIYWWPRVFKIDKNGDVIWNKIYKDNESHEKVYSILPLSDSGYIMVGSSFSINSPYSKNIWIMKLNSDGTIAWKKNYPSSTYGYIEEKLSIEETIDKGYILSGSTRIPLTDFRSKIWVLKLDSNGEIIWQKIYGTDNLYFHEAYPIQKTSDGGYILAGNNLDDTSNWDVLLFKLDSYGNISDCIEDIIGVTNESAININNTTFEDQNINRIDTNVSPKSGSVIISDINPDSSNICVGEDSTPPLGNVTINEGTLYTNSISVNLILNCSDSGSGCAEMQFSNDGSIYTTPEPYSTTKTWFLTSGDGEKTVYAKFKDKAGNWSSAFSDTIILDQNSPIDGTLTATAGNQQVSLSWVGFSDLGSGIGGYTIVFSTSGTPTSCSDGILIYSGTEESYIHSFLTNGTTYYYRLCAKDNAGNISTGVTANATPTAIQDTDGDGLEDTWEVTYFGNLSQGPNDDPDNDGWTNMEEYNLGTHPYQSDVDSDNDRIPDAVDNCPSVYNPGQEDTDGDGIGDVCDNCPLHYNPLQEDLDGDKIGNACDRDADGDGFDSIYYGGSDCDDLDSNVYPGRGCPEIVGAAAPKSSTPSDRDGDGVPDTSDNCPNFYNPNQVIPTWYKDADNDGYSDGNTITQCNRPNGYKLINELIATTGDCDDNNPAINPKTVWFKDADNDGYGDAFASPIIQCSQPTGYKLASQLIATNTDCNDNDPNINPGIAEILDDGKDNDCNPNTPDQVSLYNIVFEMEGYDTWLPTDGAQVTVTFKVKGPSGEEINTPISFILKSVTKHPGKYTNDSSDDDSPDFTWSSNGNQIHFTSHDFGGKITITATATIDGIEIHNDFTLPKDIDGDGIADAWEMEQFGTLANGASADPDQDGLSNFKEYRGFVWGRLVPYLGYCSLNNERTCTKVTDCGPTDGTCLPYQTPAYVPDRNPDGSVKVAHFRTNPNIKDLFVKYDNFDTDFPFAIGEAFATAGVDVHALDSSLIVSQRNIDVATITLEEKPYGLENGHINKRGIRDWDFDTLGYSGIGTSNQYGAASVYKPALANYFTDKPYKDLASSGQGNGMLDNITAVQDKNDNGLNDKAGRTYETGCSTCQWTTDVVVMANYIPQFEYQLSPMDVNNNGMVELPLVADSTKINPEKEYTLLQVLKHVITHELGHAVGMTENSFGTCVMYQYTTDWSRDNYFSPFARDQMLIHNQSVTNP